MLGVGSFRSASGKRAFALASWGVLLLVSVLTGTAQVNGVPPLVTSIPFHVPPFLPNIRPSVTSLGPNGFMSPAGPLPQPYGVPRTIYGHGIYGHGNKIGYGYSGFGATYAAPFYVPMYDTSDSYDPGPYLYSGPPAEQILHIVVDTPPARQEAVAEDGEDAPPPAPTKAKHEHDAGPVEQTILVFRDGHKQEVNTYVIMGQTVYVFDSRTQKIALGDLDVPATIKANDDRGIAFQLPSHKAS